MISQLAQELGRKAKELVNGMQDRCGRNPDIADFAAAFQKILDEPKDAPGISPGSADVKCHCGYPASFIVDRQALCYNHWREKRDARWNR